MEEFLANGNKGVRITFKNGVSVSIQWGPFNYCNNNPIKGPLAAIQEPREKNHWFCKDAEIAIWKHGGDWITKEWKDHEDDVVGYQSPKDALDALIWAENYEPPRPNKK